MSLIVFVIFNLFTLLLLFGLSLFCKSQKLDLCELNSCVSRKVLFCELKSCVSRKVLFMVLSLGRPRVLFSCNFRPYKDCQNNVKRQIMLNEIVSLFLLEFLKKLLNLSRRFLVAFILTYQTDSIPVCGVFLIPRFVLG